VAPAPEATSTTADVPDGHHPDFHVPPPPPPFIRSHTSIDHAPPAPTANRGESAPNLAPRRASHWNDGRGSTAYLLISCTEWDTCGRVQDRAHSEQPDRTT